MNILLIDDDVHLTAFLAKSLESEGFIVRVPKDMDSAVAEMRSLGYKLIILDLNLRFSKGGPVDGLKLLKQLRSEGLATPVIVLSARDRVSDRMEALNLGADDYITKPFSFAELPARIRAILRRGPMLPNARTPSYSCFFSYSSKDQEFADRLHNDLQAQGVRCWFAPKDLKIGARLRPSFDDAIRSHDKLIVVLSKNSVESPWVEKEVETAFERERQESRIVLFPIRLDDAAMETSQPWAADIRRMRHIGDFREWKNDTFYKQAIDRLLRDLGAEGQASSAAQQ